MNCNIGLKQIFFGSSAKKTAALSFEARQNHTKGQIKLKREINETAENLHLSDFYTGRRFEKMHYKSTIEHLHPYSKKKSIGEVGLTSINSLENFVPVGDAINNKRATIPLKKWYEMHPDYLENGRNALKEYEKVNTRLIDGKKWVAGLKKTLNSELGYIAFTGKTVQKNQNLSYALLLKFLHNIPQNSILRYHNY